MLFIINIIEPYHSLLRSRLRPTLYTSAGNVAPYPHRFTNRAVWTHSTKELKTRKGTVTFNVRALRAIDLLLRLNQDVWRHQSSSISEMGWQQVLNGTNVFNIVSHLASAIEMFDDLKKKLSWKWRIIIETQFMALVTSRDYIRLLNADTYLAKQEICIMAR